MHIINTPTHTTPPPQVMPNKMRVKVEAVYRDELESFAAKVRRRRGGCYLLLQQAQKQRPAAPGGTLSSAQLPAARLADHC